MRRVALVSSVIAVAALAWFNYASLSEAYGGGPPYYSRSTNMDKWSNPLPVLIPLDSLAVGAAALLLTRRRLRH